MRVSGLVLAAGAGTRFGQATKQLAPLRGKPLLQYAVDSMSAVLPCVVVLGYEAEAIRAQVDLAAVDVVVCDEWQRGQAFSLRYGVAAVPRADAVVITLGDQPFITPQVIMGALGELAGFDAVRAVYDGVPGHPVVLSRRVMDAVGELDGDAGARELLARFRVRTWEAGHLASATDIDTPEELSRV